MSDVERGDAVIRAVLVTRADMGRALAAVTPAFIDLVRSMPPEAAERQVPGLEWTAAEVAVHVITVAGRGLGDDRRAGSVVELGELNQICIDEVDLRAPVDLADRLTATFAASAAVRRDPEAPFELHAGVVTDMVTASSYLLADLLVHGFDISRATGQAWRVDPAPAAVALRAALPAMGPWVRPDVANGPRQSVMLDFGDGGPPVEVSAGEGVYRAGARTDAAASEVHAPADQVLLEVAGRQRSGDARLAGFAAWYLPI